MLVGRMQTREGLTQQTRGWWSVAICKERREKSALETNQGHKGMQKLVNALLDYFVSTNIIPGTSARDSDIFLLSVGLACQSSRRGIQLRAIK